MPDTLPPGLAVLLLAADHRNRLATPSAAGLAAALGADLLVVRRSDPFWPHLDLAANIALPLRARGIARSDRRRQAAELLGLCGLDDAVGRAVGSLSALDHRRALLARALAAAPAALVLDQLTAGIGDADRTTLQIMIRRTARSATRRTMVITTERAEALALADLIAVATPGTDALAFAAPADLLRAPPSALVAAALAEANLLTARVTDDPDADPDDSSVRLPSGDAVPARLAPGVGPGQLCLLAVAPARVAFAAVPADQLGGDALAASLTELRHCGTHLRLRVRLGDGTAIIVHRPPGSLGERDARRAAEPGGASVAWRSIDATAFPHPES